MLRMRKIISLVIAFAIVMVPSISSFAMESSQNYDLKIPSIGEKLEIIPIDQKTINVSLGTEKGTIHIVSDNSVPNGMLLYAGELNFIMQI